MKKIKSKITAGVGLLFTVILILSILGIFFINKIAQGFKGTIKDNYRSISYSYIMLADLDGIYNIISNKVTTKLTGNYEIESDNNLISEMDSQFEKYLILELNNITENGEQEARLVLNNTMTNLLIQPGKLNLPIINMIN